MAVEYRSRVLASAPVCALTRLDFRVALRISVWDFSGA